MQLLGHTVSTSLLGDKADAPRYLVAVSATLRISAGITHIGKQTTRAEYLASERFVTRLSYTPPLFATFGRQPAC